MTREIKFRIWDNIRNIYLEDDGGIRLNCTNGNLHGCKSNGNVPQWSAEQYTGLKDKNGKEIYEGDILQRLKKSGQPYMKTKVVEFCRPAFRNCCYTEESIVIGNIHENPELLK